MGFKLFTFHLKLQFMNLTEGCHSCKTQIIMDCTIIIQFHKFYHMGLEMRKLDFVACHQQRYRPDCIFV